MWSEYVFHLLWFVLVVPLVVSGLVCEELTMPRGFARSRRAQREAPVHIGIDLGSSRDVTAVTMQIRDYRAPVTVDPTELIDVDVDVNPYRDSLIARARERLNAQIAEAFAIPVRDAQGEVFAIPVRRLPRPMRLSVEQGDPGYSPAAFTGSIQVFLDGVEQRYVITADEEQGYIKRYRVDAYGGIPFCFGGRPATEECRGVVIIVMQTAVEHHAQYERARQRSRDLLRAWLSPAQLNQYDRTLTFEVVGSQGGHYRISMGLADELDDSGKIACRWCFGPMGHLPFGDVMLARKIALETDEAGTRKIANRMVVAEARVISAELWRR